ncbi:2Fe-2S iron-sulfur cluster-binding protein [Ramlibacter algicola]|uniref:2Fe-2S iron-sulfur cluster binding domain-containing protein n=1 Tax=Ramlibacter algicola TaxID=2795217 RepID=A0A934Q4U3_9BURK|nr:2Fe-2S iron-sulfur cluster-binding protein [Ramlibacter algicola]MBK0394938.1 2Fe-2S iron-sulfur cluster binding domain-containing protein [Ramlibacter algicola]
MTHTIRIEGSDVAFACAPGTSVLDAALGAGIELPYSCRKGVCGNCAGNVVAGEVDALDGAALRNETCSADQVLFCACAPRTDLVLRPASWKHVDRGARKTFRAKVHALDLAAPDVTVLRLRLPAGQRAKFQAGQYLEVKLDDGSARCYSMANPPQESDAVTLHVRHVPGGRFTNVLAGLKQGDLLDIELPFGNVALAQDDARPIVFVAGGTGFAPVKSILDDMAKRRVQRAVTLIWGARDAAGLYLPAAIDKWRKQWPQLRYVPAISDAPTHGVAGAFDGRVDEALRAQCPDLTGHVLHCCGSPAMVAAVRAAALDVGLAPSDFHADVFVPGPASPAP